MNENNRNMISKQNKPRRRYFYRGVCSVLLIGLALMLFLVIWLTYITENSQRKYLLGYGNVSMALFLYTMIFSIMGKFLHAFKIGVERKSKLLASVILTVCLTDFIEIFISVAILGNFRYIFRFAWRYVFLAAVQSVILGAVASSMVNIYRKLVRPLSVVMIFGDQENNILNRMNSIPQKYHITKKIYYNEPDLDLSQVIERSSSILINDVPASVENEIIKLCFEKNVRVYVVPHIADILLKSSENLNVMDTPLFLSRNLGMGLSQRIVKRTMDLIISSLALVVFSPVFLFTSLAIKFEDGGPVFFSQERVTKDGKHFMILKFRSMIVDAEKDGKPHPAGEKDDRITKVGRFIRACRIDELPQLINILVGEMSIVGPRPERYEHVEKYSKEIPEFRYREKVKGGLTGYAQVYGKYNTTALDKLKLDLIYITNYSVWLDFQILFETVKILFQKESTEGFSDEQTKKMHDYRE